MDPAGHRPVFLDPKGRRAKLTNLSLLLIAIICVLGVALVLFGIVISPRLPAIPLSVSDKHSFTAFPLNSSRSSLPVSPSRSRHVSKDSGNAMRLAFLSEAAESTTVSLQRVFRQLDGIIPDWLQIDRAEIGAELQAGQRRRTIVRWLRRHAPHIAIYPRLTSALTAGETASRLANATSRARLVEQIGEFVGRSGFGGIVVDLAGLPPSGHHHLAAFLTQLARELQPKERKVILVARPYVERHRLQALSRLVDYVLVFAHDETHMRAEPGPAASQGWFEEQVWNRLAVIPNDKLIISIGSFGYDFDQHGTKTLLSVQQAWDLLERSGAMLRFDSRSFNPSFTYRDGEGRHHQVWLLDAVTAFNQVKAALAVKPAGLAIWRLGLEEPGLWKFAGRHRLPDRRALVDLRSVEAGTGSFSRAQGAVLDTRPGRDGVRTVAFDRRLGLIAAQALKSTPRQAEFVEWHAIDPKAIALTFDDGPDPRYTPRVLDILAQKNARATFYILGTSALSSLDLVERIYREGHDLGNHSFSHADLFAAGPEMVAAELNTTQRIVESRTGVRTTLFRTPYAMTGYGYLETSPHLTETASRLGYVHGGIDVDSFDYAAPVDWIVDRVVKQVREGRAQAVLLHDSGGDREAMLKALPRIIDELQAEGFRFVTTHELVGLQRKDFMPPLSRRASQTEAALRLGPVRFVAWLGGVLPVVAIGSAVLGILRLTLVALAAFVQSRRSRARKPAPSFDGAITVLVPAYNEEAVICKTVRGLLASTVGDRIEILVVDDGSADRTTEVVTEEFGKDSRVKVFRKENGGKATALNYGISCTSSDIIIAIDGDTVLLPDAIEKLTARFADPSIGAVAGRVIVGNRVNLMTRFQALEYVTSQNLDRRAFELVNGIGVVPGAIGAWRRQALIEAGGYSHDTLAEDADLTITLERRGWKVVGEPAAVALTEAPESLRSFMKQRFRWMFGMLQVAFKHLGSVLERPTGVSMVTIPNILLFQFGFTLLAPLMDVLLAWSLLFALLSSVMGLSSSQGETLLLLAQYWLLFQTVDIAAAMVGIALDGNRGNWRLVPLVLLQRFSYRQLLYVTAVRSLLAAIKGTLVGWGKLVRTGRVAAPPQPT